MNSAPNTEAGPIAILMSVYHRDDPALFERALLSILNQDYTGGEIRIYLCVDGPISSPLNAVVNTFEAELFEVIRNQANRGLAYSLNRLIDSLQEEQFVFRMDSDDFAHSYRCSLQIEKLREDASIDVLGGGVNEVDSSGAIIKTVRHPRRQTEILKYIAKRNPLSHPTVCFTRTAIDRFEHYPETRVNQDWALWFKCIGLGLNLSNVDDILVDMTISEDFFARRGALRAWEELSISIRGVASIYGITWRMIYPLMRYVFRLTPTPVIKLAYRSRFR